MSLTSSSKTYQPVIEQARRISACRLTFFTDRGNGAESRHNGAFVQDAITFSNAIDDNQPSFWQDRVRRIADESNIRKAYQALNRAGICPGVVTRWRDQGNSFNFGRRLSFCQRV